LARNEAKIIQKLAEIKTLASRSGHVIQTSYEVVDFSKQFHIADYDAIAKRLSTLDIGFLICNAGSAAVGDFSRLTNE
jgi:short-subunit dehydrogenase